MNKHRLYFYFLLLFLLVVNKPNCPFCATEIRRQLLALHHTNRLKIITVYASAEYMYIQLWTSSKLHRSKKIESATNKDKMGLFEKKKII